MTTESYDLLIMLCCGIKDDNHMAMPAICRYDGTNFRTLRARLRALQGLPKRYPFNEVVASVPAWLDIRIISGVFALLSYDTPTPYYDSQGIFSATIRARILQGLAAVKESKGQPVHLAYVGGEHPIGELLANLGKMYPESIYQRFMGRPGEQAHALKTWLIDRWGERSRAL